MNKHNSTWIVRKPTRYGHVYLKHPRAETCDWVDCADRAWGFHYKKDAIAMIALIDPTGDVNPLTSLCTVIRRGDAAELDGPPF